MSRQRLVGYYAQRTRKRHCKWCDQMGQELHKVRTPQGLTYACASCRSKRIAAVNAALIARKGRTT